jgi:hypothetical protein
MNKFRCEYAIVFMEDNNELYRRQIRVTAANDHAALKIAREKLAKSGRVNIEFTSITRSIKHGDFER